MNSFEDADPDLVSTYKFTRNIIDPGFRKRKSLTSEKTEQAQKVA